MVEVRSPMVAKVIEVLVTPGIEVAAEDELIVVESMKMQIPMTAPVAGTVAAVHVRVGDNVRENDLLVTLN